MLCLALWVPDTLLRISYGLLIVVANSSRALIQFPHSNRFHRSKEECLPVPLLLLLLPTALPPPTPLVTWSLSASTISTPIDHQVSSSQVVPICGPSLLFLHLSHVRVIVDRVAHDLEFTTSVSETTRQENIASKSGMMRGDRKASKFRASSGISPLHLSTASLR